MAKRSFTLILPVLAILDVACGADRIVEPKPKVLGRLEMYPIGGTLSVGVQNGLQLTTVAYDPAGALIRGPGPFTFSSSAPAIAEVSHGGWVTAVAPGTAEITATLTMGGVTRADTMTVTVYAVDLWDIPGVYDLTAPITSFDPARGGDSRATDTRLPSGSGMSLTHPGSEELMKMCGSSALEVIPLAWRVPATSTRESISGDDSSSSSSMARIIQGSPSEWVG